MALALAHLEVGPHEVDDGRVASDLAVGPGARLQDEQVAGSRAVLYIADLVGESRTFGGRRWSPILNAPAEMLELIDAANGQLVTVVRAAFLPDPPSSPGRWTLARQTRVDVPE